MNKKGRTPSWRSRYREAEREFKFRAIGLLGKFLIDAIGASSRIDILHCGANAEVISSGRYLMAFWHQRIFMLSYLYRGRRALIMSSASRDGEYSVRVLQRQSHECIRGSSSRGGTRALVTMIHRLRKESRIGVVIPDGPRGPRHIVKAGLITLAQKTGMPILPMTYSAARIKVLNSWDRFIMPMPFTRCRVIYGEPLQVPARIDPDTAEALRLQLQDEIRRITLAADNHFGHDLT